jgi:cytochrome P450
VVGETLFGTDVDEGRSVTVRRAMTDTLGMFDRVYSPLFRLLVRLPSPTMRRYHRLEADLNRVIGEMITERRAAGLRGTDLLSLLLRAREEGTGMTDEEVRDQALTLFLAGHETTAIALTWTWWLLARNADAEQRLHDELDAVLGERSPTVADLPDLPYTQAVVAESLRLRPPVWAMGRTTVREHRADGHTIAPGSIVVVAPWLLHHDERWWPDPQGFRPGRWLGSERDDRPRYAFLPFGGGPRVCIGEPFARMEAAMIVASIGRRWRFGAANADDPELQAVITLRPRDGLPMVTVRR